MTKQIQTKTKVFISYSWDSDDHKKNVLGLANTLRLKVGIDAQIDRYVQAKPPYTPPQGWNVWMSERIEWAEFVLIIFTETYKRRFEGKEETGIGLGVSWEGAIIRNDIYNAQLRDTKFIPVVFSQSDLGYIPLVLNSRDRYILTDENSFRELNYRLRKQPSIIIPEIAQVSLPLPSEPVLFSPQKLTLESVEQQTSEITYRKMVERYVNEVPLSEPYNEISEINQINLVTIRQIIGLAPDKAKAIENDVLQLRCKLHEEYKQKLQEADNLLIENLELLLYTQLEYSLEKESWIEADEITKNLLLKVTNVQQKYFSLTDFQKIPCKDIRKIDKLWTDYSKGHFGYSAQIDIWQQVKKRAEVQDILFDFFVALDWGFYNEDHRFVYIDKFKYDLPNPPKGHRPVSVLWDGGSHETRQAYIKRIQKCCKDFVL